MDLYLLDTNVASALLKGNHPNLTRHSESVAIERQIIPSIVRAELQFGWRDATHYASRISELDAFLEAFPSSNFDDQAAREYGILRSLLKKTGSMIGPNDLIIASIALANQYILVTHNTSEFKRVPGLKLEDWQIV